MVFGHQPTKPTPLGHPFSPPFPPNPLSWWSVPEDQCAILLARFCPQGRSPKKSRDDTGDLTRVAGGEREEFGPRLFMGGSRSQSILVSFFFSFTRKRRFGRAAHFFKKNLVFLFFQNDDFHLFEFSQRREGFEPFSRRKPTSR